MNHRQEILVKQATINELNDVADLFDQYRMFYGQPSDIDGARQFLFELFVHSESVIFVAGMKGTEQFLGFT